ncbi:hypothetical protein LTR62_002374 [Meristemomyces frigidus]|uniref:Uncharacterized protein n=1 Tax=Meristemomyces frigidus TaxID=1508187 RepID=A0AAN7T8E2_9PEZI|nr:hypothetical protein LTR62_002374 [Meristemomyces frigidus]
MTGHLGKRKQGDAEEHDNTEEGRAAKIQARQGQRRDEQQPTPPDSVENEHLNSPRNLIGFDFNSISTYPDADRGADGDPVTEVEASHDHIFPAFPMPHPPSPSLVSARDLYDPEFGAKVVQRFASIQQARERRYGYAIAAAFPPGRTPLLARNAEELAQMELKRRYIEINDVREHQQQELEGQQEGQQKEWWEE